MAYNAVPTVTTGDTWSAANHNTYIRDNFAAGIPDIFTAAGDIAYATAANAASPLAIGSPGLPLVSDGSVPVWGSFVYKRQGGSSSDWSVGVAAETTDSGSSDNYTPSKSIIQCGSAIGYSSSNDEAVTVNITFPQEFTEAPVIVFSVNPGSHNGNLLSQEVLDIYDGTRASLRITFDAIQGTAGNAHTFLWFAVGPVA